MITQRAHRLKACKGVSGMPASHEYLVHMVRGTSMAGEVDLNKWDRPAPDTGIPHRFVTDTKAQYREKMLPIIRKHPSWFIVGVCEFHAGGHCIIGNDWRPGVDFEYLGDHKLRGPTLADETHIEEDMYLFQVWQKRK
jgi:hypothetical protein